MSPIKVKAEGSGNDDIRYQQARQNEPEQNTLVAVHNTTGEELQKSLSLGGFPMPSIAITQAEVGHAGFGEISLLFDKNSIDPSDRRNRVYGGDAWTPMFPEVGYKLNEKKTSDIYSRANKTGSLPFFNPVSFHPSNYERQIDGLGSESLVKHFLGDYGAKQFYLAETGNAVQEYEQHEVEKYPANKIALYEETLEKIGIDRLKNENYDALEDEVKQLLGRHGIELEGLKPFRVERLIGKTIESALDYAENGNRKTETDFETTKRKIDERVDSKKFEEWLEELFTGVVEKEGIRNDKDPFTPSGNSRKWESLYDEITLDSVVKAMQKQAAKGGTGVFRSNIFGAAAKEFTNLDDIRHEARQRIRSVLHEESQAEKDRLTARLEQVNVPSASGSFSDAMDFVENVKDAVAKSHTPKGIYSYLRDFYSDMTMEVAEEIADIVREIQLMATWYFEAKPNRAVGFDEVRLAVVPSDTDTELVRQLERRHIPVRVYEHGNEQQRRELVADATAELDIRFRQKEVDRLSPEETSTLREGEKASAAQNLADELGVPVRVVRSTDEISGEESRFREKRGATGWHDRATDEIAVVLPNCADAAEVQRTILHEAVSHYGLPQLLGRERADELYRRVFDAVRDTRRGRELLAEHGSETVAGDEYLAEMAEGNVSPEVFRLIMAAVRDFFREVLGVDLKLTDTDLRYLLWRSRHNLERSRTVGEAKDKKTGLCFHQVFHGSPHDFEQFYRSFTDVREGVQIPPKERSCSCTLEKLRHKSRQQVNPLRAKVIHKL